MNDLIHSPRSPRPLWAWRTAALLALLLLLAAPALRAQDPGSGGPVPDPPTAVPLDGGATLLLLAGSGYALRRLRRR